MVIGGGDTGNDCVGTSIRLGAKIRHPVLEMMPKAPDTDPEQPLARMAESARPITARKEAIAMFSDPRIYTTTVKGVHIGDKAGNLKKAVCCKLESKKDEKTGRMMMVPIEGSEFTLDVDVVLIAAGFLGSQDYVTKGLWRGGQCQNQCQHRSGPVQDQRGPSLHRRRHAPGSVPGSLGHPLEAERPPARWIWI